MPTDRYTKTVLTEAIDVKAHVDLSYAKAATARLRN
jgi:hypothetical protein